jgi:hypothetical protein
MVAPSFLSTLFFALAVAAQTVERKALPSQLRFTKRVSASLYNIVNLDRLRVNAIKGFNVFEVFSNSSAENIGVSYIVSVGVGSPPTICKWLQHLVADYKFLTGSSIHRWSSSWHGKVSGLCAAPNVRLKIPHSSNTWLGAGKAYVNTSTSQKTSNSVVSWVGPRAICLLSWINSLFYMDQVISAASFRWAQSD